MHLLGISLFLAYLLYTNLASDFSHRDYNDEYAEQEPMDEPDTLPKPDMEQKLRSASSVDELMSLIYPSYWAALKCRSKLSAAASSASKFTPRPQTHRLRPLSEAEEPTYAAAYLNLDVLKSIELEWRKTQCMPRCGGCCPSEDKQCRNISTGYLSKTLFEITVPLTQGTKPVTISVANHTQCSCLSKLDIYRQVHSIIRRALPECAVANRTCPPGQVWNTKQCQCISMASVVKPPPPPLLHLRSPQQHHDILSSDLCGPDKELDVESCQCVCRLENPTRDCGPKRHLDRNTCQCVCNMLPAPSCPQNHVFNKETCQCTCNKTCPRHQPLNKTKCSCECNESPNKCFLRGRRFHQATCSCLRPPCEVRRRKCEAGFFFSEEVCRCVPSHWRRLD
ncbi:vascular endothelial growth factor C isoform X2 [Gambusia affinis]|uniref:vascular endothelial growth factor C isoform X2 n=1 Tax=Gambusia affinis TaxID=33528 RepID=UPI001CDC2D3A|nr:vascular endothelial growth factor C isoform X2 [Gambusia affinis]